MLTRYGRCGKLWSTDFKTKFRQLLKKLDQFDDGSSGKPFLLHLKDVKTGESVPVQVGMTACMHACTLLLLFA